jgi:isoleucyl-tRNA synthetase
LTPTGNLPASSVLRASSQMMAPILPHMAEDIWLNLPYTPSTKSVFQGGWVKGSFPPHRTGDWERIMALRGDVNKCIELARAEKLVGSSLEREVRIHSEDESLRVLLAEFQGDTDLRYPSETSNTVDDLKYVILASQAVVAPSASAAVEGCGESVLTALATESGCTIGVARARGAKCERCWRYCETVGSADHPDVCPRCSNAYSEWKSLGVE